MEWTQKKREMAREAFRLLTDMEPPSGVRKDRSGLQPNLFFYNIFTAVDITECWGLSEREIKDLIKQRINAEIKDIKKALKDY